jgi:hypothetical protein
MDNQEIQLSKKDINRLRELAKRRLEIANDPVNLERRQAWYSHDAGDDNSRVMVLVEAGGIRDADRPVSQEVPQCEHPWAKGLEYGFLSEFYRFENLKDDGVIEPILSTGWDLTISNYGVEAVTHTADEDVILGARTWDAPIKDIQRDFDKLKPRSYSINRETSIARQQFLSSIFDGIMEVEISSGYWWTLGMTTDAINLIGLENLMLFMYDDPKGLHRLMAFLRDDKLAFAKWLEKEGFLCLNNKNHYTGSGSLGYTHDLPQKDWKKGDKVRTKDLWVLLESQETVSVGPDQFVEFVFPYQQDIAKEFGKVYYGCCEPVNNRWHVLKNMSNLSRVSVSPWCDEAFMAEALGRDYVYSRKPNPTLISTHNWDEELIRKDLHATLDTAKDCRLEIIMKDVHTLNNQPERMSRWIEIVREEINKS